MTCTADTMIMYCHRYVLQAIMVVSPEEYAAFAWCQAVPVLVIAGALPPADMLMLHKVAAQRDQQVGVS